MRRSVALLGLASSTLIAAALTLMPVDTPQAASRGTFVIPANDGYGVADCLMTGGECSASVANAWCQANGFGRAAAYGPVAREEITGSIETANVRSAAAFSVTCAD